MGGARWELSSRAARLNGVSSSRAPVLPVLSGSPSPLWRGAHGAGTTERCRPRRSARDLFIRPPPPPLLQPSHPDSQFGVSACYGFVFVHLCLLSSCHTHTHTLVSVLMPVSLPSRTGPSCPRICPLRHFVVQRRAVMSPTAARFPLAPSATEADLPLRIMRP